MTRRRLPASGTALLLAALLLTSCSGDQGASKGDPVAGKRLFVAQRLQRMSYVPGGRQDRAPRGQTSTPAAPGPAKVMRPVDSPGRPHAELRRPADGGPEARPGGVRRRGATSPGKAGTVPFGPDSARLAECARRTSYASSGRSATLTTTGARARAGRARERMSRTNDVVAGDCQGSRTGWDRRPSSRYKDNVAPAFIDRTPVCASGCPGSSSAPSRQARRTSSADRLTPAVRGLADRRRSRSCNTSASTGSVTGS